MLGAVGEGVGYASQCGSSFGSPRNRHSAPYLSASRLRFELLYGQPFDVAGVRHHDYGPGESPIREGERSDESMRVRTDE